MHRERRQSRVAQTFTVLSVRAAKVLDIRSKAIDITLSSVGRATLAAGSSPQSVQGRRRRRRRGSPPPPAAARRPEARPESRQSCAAQSVQVTKPRPGQSRDGPAKTKKHMKKAPSVKRTSRTSPSFTPAVYTATLFSTQRQHKDRCPADFNVPRFCSSTLHSSRPPAPALSAFT